MKNKIKRPSWDEYFMNIAFVVAKRSTCGRRTVGAILVKDKRILATGYNGSVSGLAHCDVAGCLREKLNIPSGQKQELCRGLHAEQNALLFASKAELDMSDSVVYCTHQPCVLCAKMLIQCKIKRVVFSGDYPDKLALALFKEAKIKLVRFIPAG